VTFLTRVQRDSFVSDSQEFSRWPAKFKSYGRNRQKTLLWLCLCAVLTSISFYTNLFFIKATNSVTHTHTPVYIGDFSCITTCKYRTMMFLSITVWGSAAKWVKGFHSNKRLKTVG